MTSKSIELDFEIEYVSCELPDERVESKPYLRTYYDTHFIRSEEGGGIITTEMDEHDTTKIYEGTMKAETLLPQIPTSSSIGFASYAMRRNAFDQACYASAGTADVNVGDIMNDIKISGKFERELPLVMETTRLTDAEPVEKGRIIFRVKSARTGNAISFTTTSCMNAPLDQINGMLESFLQERIGFEASLDDTWPGIKNVRAPMDISSAGIQKTKHCFVPIEGFAMAEPLVTNVGYYQNAYERTMIRRNLNPRQDFKLMDLAHKAEIMAELCVFASQNFEYLTDSIDRNNRKKGPYNINLKVGFEHMSQMGITFSGDCEDSASLAKIFFEAFGPLRIDAKLNPELYEMQQIAANYTFFLTLATVHGAKADDKTEHIGAHMYGLLLPNSQVKDALARTEIGASMAEKLPLEHDGRDYPTLFCEGTGKIRPLGTGAYIKAPRIRDIIRPHLQYTNHPISHDPLFMERRYMSMMKCKGGLKTEIPHDVGAESSFYLGNIMLVTNKFMSLGYNIGAFICGNIHDEGQITRGTPFVDIITQKENFALMPLKPLPQNIMEITREATALREPPRPFVLDKSKPMTGLVIEPQLERLKTNVNTKGRNGSSPYGSVDLFARPHHFDKHSINQFISEVERMKFIHKFDYELENITNTVCTYRLMFFVDRDSVNQK